MYKISTEKKVTGMVKKFYVQGLSDCLAKGVKILDDMKSSLLFAPVRFNTWKSEI